MSITDAHTMMGTRQVAARPAAAEPPAVQPLEAALMALTEELRDSLGALAGSPDEFAEQAIGIFPYGHRVILQTYDLITTSTSRPKGQEAEEGAEDPRLKVHLTDLGRQVIAVCASPSGAVGDVAARAEELHRRFQNDLPFETREAES